MLCFASLAILLLGHLFQVQVGEHTALAAAAAKEDNMSFVLPAHRGEILDSNGQVLVGTVATFVVIHGLNKLRAYACKRLTSGTHN